MKKKVLIFRHVDCEGPGYLLECFDKNNVSFELIKIDQKQRVPRSLANVSGLVFMGGSMSVNDPLPWIDDEVDLIQHALKQNIPLLGHCLGGQLIAKAMGGLVVKNKVQEIGWFNVDKLDSPMCDAWFNAAPSTFEVFHWHGETFTIPAGATNVLSNAHCANQCFAMDSVLALQCHLEMTVASVEEWVDRFSDQLTGIIPSLQTPEMILQNLPERIKALNSIANSVYQHWISLLKD